MTTNRVKSAAQVAAEIDASYITELAVAITPFVSGVTTAEVQEVIDQVVEDLTDQINAGELQTATDVLWWLQGGAR